MSDNTYVIQAGMMRYQSVLMPNNEYYQQQNYTTISDSIEERIRNSFAEIDEERLLTSLSSPEPELDQILFPPELQV